MAGPSGAESQAKFGLTGFGVLCFRFGGFRVSGLLGFYSFEFLGLRIRVLAFR